MKLLDKIFQFKISPYQRNVFLINMLLIFVMVLIQHLHLKPPTIFNSFSAMITPLPAKIDPFDKLIPKLEKTPSTFKLKKPTPLIPTAQAEADFDQASAYGVVNLDTGEVIFSKNFSQKLPIASVTKVLSSIVALDLAPTSDLFSVDQAALDAPATKLALHQGEKYSLNELLTASLLVSANDAMQIINDGIDQKYGSGSFVRAMNAKAQFLGMTNSYFTNAQGFDDGDPASSVEDLTILMQYTLRNYPQIKEITSLDHADLAANTFHQEQYLNNWNGLVGVYPGTYGLKIGNTSSAKYTTAVVSNRGGENLLVIVLGASGILERDTYAAELLDLGYQKTLGLAPVNVTKDQLMVKYNSWKYFN